MDSQHSFFNTTHESGDYLNELIANAKSLEERVLEVYKAFPNERISASEVYRYLDKRVEHMNPLTSVRRAISVLKEKKLLSMTSHKVQGMYGRNEFCYILR